MPKPKPLYMETTEISPERTAGEITALLVSAGARQIAMEYGDGGKIVGMNFVLMVEKIPFPFKLPVRTKALHEVFRQRRENGSRWNDPKAAEKDAVKAERIAWRQLLRWVQAQLAMVDAGMVETREVFSPYLLDRTGRTLFEHLEETRYKALPAPEAV